MPSSVAAAWAAAEAVVATSILEGGIIGTIAETIGVTATTAMVYAGKAVATYAITAGVNSLLSSGGSGGAAASPASTGGAFAAQANTRTHMLRSTVANRQIIYGQVMISGPMVYATSNDAYGTLHLAIALAAHECEEIGEVYFNDEALGALSSEGVPTGGRYHLQTMADGSLSHPASDNQGVNREPPTNFQFNYVTLPHAPLTISISDSGLTIANNPSGTPYTSAPGTWTNVGYDSVAAGMKKNYPNDPGTGYIPWRQFGVNGNIVKLSASQSLPNGITITYTTTSGATVSYYARIRKHLGHVDQAADAALIGLGGGWTSQHRLRGVAYIVASMGYSQDVYPRGIPNIKAVVKGKKLYDPRTGNTVWSDNPALVARDYLTGTHGLGCTSAEINDASFISAANICDELVALDGGGATQKRYTCNGVVDTGQRPTDILAAIVSSCGGMLVWQGGTWIMHAGAYSAPVGVALDADDLRGPIKVSARVTRADLFNAVKGTFVDPARGWLPQDFPMQRNSTYVANDGGEEIIRDLTLPMTTNNVMAQRLAKMALDRARQGIIVNWPGKANLLGVTVGATKTITLPHLGWSAKEFRVIDWALSETGAVDLTLQEEASASYSWNYGIPIGVDPAPDYVPPSETTAPSTALPDALDVPEPTSLTCASGTDQLVFGGDGTVVSRIHVTWAAPPPYVIGTELRYRRTSETVWQPAETNPADAWIVPVEDLATYIIQSRHVAPLGYKSDWITVEHVVIGKSQPPSNVQSFFIDGDTLTWSTVGDIDLAGYRIRFNCGTANLSWGSANDLHTGLLTSSPYTMLTRPAGPVVLMVKAVDTSGNESLDIAAIVTDLGDPVVANVVESFDYHAAAFPGTITTATVDGGTGDLIANDASGQFWNPNAATTMWSGDSTTTMWPGSAYHACGYAFTFAPSAGAAGSNLTLPATIEGAGWSITYRQRGINLMWGASGAPMWASDDAMWSSDPMQPMWLNASSAMWETTGDMWTAPGYSVWPGSVTAQRDDYDFMIAIAFGATQGRISALEAQVDVPDQQVSYADVAIGAGGARLAIGAGWYAVTNVNLTLQDDGGSGYTAKIIDKNASLGPLVRVFNSSGTAVAGVLDAIVQGY